jgi:hypothetical protein
VLLLLIIALNVAGWSGFEENEPSFEYGAMANVCGLIRLVANTYCSFLCHSQFPTSGKCANCECLIGRVQSMKMVET